MGLGFRYFAVCGLMLRAEFYSPWDFRVQGLISFKCQGFGLRKSGLGLTVELVTPLRKFRADQSRSKGPGSQP